MTMHDSHLKGDLDPSTADFSGMTEEERQEAEFGYGKAMRLKF